MTSSKKPTATCKARSCPKNYRKDFPIFDGNKFVYLDSAATSQKPKCVIDAISDFYLKSNANPYRGVYELSARATECLNSARQKVANFINAKKEEIVFTKNATESLNLVAYSYGLNNIKKGDEIVLTILEHHSNLVPWQMVAKKKGATLKYLYLDKNLQISKRELSKITEKTKVVAVTSMSNVLGSVVDVKEIVKKAHKMGAVVVCDCTQSVAHFPLDVKDLDVDFAFFSAHKMYGPLGVGVLFGKSNLLKDMKPFLFGGDMIEYVNEQTTSFSTLPHKFEAGTQNVADIVGLGVAIDYIQKIGYDKITILEHQLYEYAVTELSKLPYIELYLPKGKRCGVLSFNVKGVHAHDVSSILDMHNVCVRSGNHCAQPLLKFLGLDSTCRISFGIYNNKKDVDLFIAALKDVYKTFEKYINKSNWRRE